mgnify:CR=1 FL=1
MAGTAAWIDVLPNLSAFGTKLNSGVTAAATSAGRNAGKKFSDAMNQAAGRDVLSEQVKSLQQAEKKAAQAVSQCTSQIAKARDEQKSAALRVQAAETKLNETVAKYGTASSQTISAQARLNDARSKARQKDEAYKSAEEQLRAAQNGLKETQTQLTAAQQKANTATGGFRNALQKWKQAADLAKSSTSGLSEAQSRFSETSRRTTARFSAMAGAVGGFTSSVVSKAVSAFASLGSLMVDASDSAQKFASTMSFAGVSDKTIQKLTASTQNYADKTVFNLSDIRNTTAQLASNGVKNYDKLAEAAGNLTAVAGGGAEAYKSVAMVLTQTAGAGKLTTENWNQLSDAIPGASGKLQAAMRKNGAFTGDFRDAMEKGQISAEEFNKTILQLGMTDVAKRAAESTTTFEGAMGNWEAAVQKFGMTVLDKVKPQLTGALNTMTDRISQFTDWFSGAWDGLAAFLSTGKVNKAFAEAFKIDKSSYAGIEDAYQRIKWGYTGLVNFVKTGEFSYEFNRAFENVDRQTLVDFKDTLLGIRDSASEVLKNLPGLGEFFNTPADGDKSNLNKALKAANVALKGLKPLLDLLASIEKAWNGLSAEQQGTIFDTAIYLWLGSKGFKILKNIFGVAKDIGKGFGIAGKGIKTADDALKSFGKFLGGLKAPKWLSSLFTKAPKVAGLDKVPTFAKLTGGTLGGVAAGAAAYGAATKTLTGGLPKWVWKGLQGVQGKDTSDKAYKAYQKWYAENNSVKNPGKFTEWMKGKLAGAKGQAFAGNTGSAQATMSSGQRDAGVKAWNGIKGAFSEAGQAQADNTAAQVKAQQDTLAGIKKAWGDAGDWINTNWCDLMVKIQSKFDGAAQWVEDRWNGVKDWFGTTGQKIGDFFSGIPSAIGGWFDSAGQWVEAKWQGICDWFSGVGSSIGGFFSGIPAAVGGFFDSAGQWVQSKWQVVCDWFAGIPGSITGFFQGIPGTFQSIFQTAKDRITGVFSSVGTWFDNNVKIPISNAVNAIGQTFQSTKDWIKRSWDQVKEAARAPVAFVVNTVYTNGIKKVWDSVAGAVGLKLSLPTVKFATGGTVGGINPGYAPGVDSIPAITSPGEAWMVPEWTKAVGAENVYRWNALARHHGVQAVREDMGLDGVQRFAKGGIASKIGKAVSGAKKFIEDLSQTAQAFVKNPVDWVTSKILTPVKSQVAGISGGQFGQMVGRLPVSAATALVDKVKSMASDLASKWTSKSEAGQYHGSVGGGVERWRSLVLQVLKELGQPASWADTVLRRMNQESGGNPNAINNWDSNAKAGMPSQGLMQTIPGTFNAYAGPYRSRGITDPLANIYAGCNYAIHRYGSLAGMNRAGGYALGGIVGDDRPTLYDRGGILPPGRHLVANETKQPELVLTREQIVKIFGADVKDKGDRTVNLNVNIPERSDPWADASILVRTARHQLR